jgi:signal transduction histidine kinase
MIRRSNPGSLRRDIVLWYSVVLLVAVTAFSILTFLLLRQALTATGRTSLRQTAEAVENIYVPPAIPRVRTQEQIWKLPRADAEVVRRRTIFASGDSLVVWLTRNDRMEERALRTFVLIALVLIPLTALLAAIGGRAIIERLLVPLDRLVEATREIGIGDLSRRVAEPGRPRELDELAHSFNEMLTRLERAVHALERFTADASHEMRTPLTSIRGTIQVALARPRSAPELEETLGEVLEETGWMLHLVDGLLTLARGEEGTALVAQEQLDLAPLLADVVEVGAALALDRPVQVRLDVPEHLIVAGSPAQLRQVFLNLVSNAVKFTERGEVVVSGRTVEVNERGEEPVGETQPEGGWVEVVVRDTGVGIEPEELPRVFDRFYRGDLARARPGGKGLGHAIARLLVDQHGGTIDVSSVPGEGSEFRVRLPALAPFSEA